MALWRKLYTYAHTNLSTFFLMMTKRCSSSFFVSVDNGSFCSLFAFAEKFDWGLESKKVFSLQGCAMYGILSLWGQLCLLSWIFFRISLLIKLNEKFPPFLLQSVPIKANYECRKLCVGPSYVDKVQILWEGHKIWKKIPHFILKSLKGQLIL